MKKFGFTLGAAALLAVSVPTQAKAIDFGAFCGGNALTTCAAVQVYVDNGYLRMDVLNLSGYMGTPENTVFTKVGLNGVSFTGASDLEVMFAGGTWNDATTYGWDFSTQPFGAGFTAELTAANANSYPGVASDCATTLPGNQTADWSTPGCLDGSVDYTQAVSFRFSYTSMTGDLADASVLLRGQNVGYGEDTEGSLVCDTATNCEPPTTVPEPASMLLLGTGLVGVLVSRRRKDDL